MSMYYDIADYGSMDGGRGKMALRVLGGVLLVGAVVTAIVLLAPRSKKEPERKAPVAQAVRFAVPRRLAHAHAVRPVERPAAPVRAATAQAMNAGEDFGDAMDMETMASSNSAPGGGDSSAHALSDSAYSMDPSMMTASSAGDDAGIEAYMPNHADMSSEEKDPSSGLPVFTTSKLQRSNQLGSYGQHGFLRKVSDSMTGARSNIGKSHCSPVEREEGMRKRRAQLEAARAGGDEDVVLWNQGEFSMDV